MPSDQEIQNRVLADFYDDHEGGFLHGHYMWRQSISDYEEQWDDAEANEIEFAITTAGEDGLLRIDGSTAQMSAEGLEQLHDSGHDTNLDESVQESILETLLEYKRQNPSGVGMSRDELVEEVGKDREVVDENVWYLDQRFYLDAETAMSTSPYHSVEITSTGRRAIQ